VKTVVPREQVIYFPHQVKPYRTSGARQGAAGGGGR